MKTPTLTAAVCPPGFTCGALECRAAATVVLRDRRAGLRNYRRCGPCYPRLTRRLWRHRIDASRLGVAHADA